GDDVLDGGGGRDDIEGGEGDDVFVVSRGRDVIGDFDEDGDDLLRLDAALTGFDTAREAFEALRFRDDDAVLRHDAGRVVLEDVDRGDIDLGDFDMV
ncbi:MAG TPA: calcium-binding protein, partial [Paracoccaceae bacterium]|nr:calcium-binding protein [Paracoccaceae bacterium]